MKICQLKDFTKLLNRFQLFSGAEQPPRKFDFQPTTFLTHPFLQSVYNLAEPRYKFEFERQKIFFEDGGHIALDWSAPQDPASAPPVLFIMHGLTGGSEMNYIRALVREAIKEKYQCVCLNSRGINTEMTSPIPFVGIEHNELDTALDLVEQWYPHSPIYLVGTSFGGNYLLRYLVRNSRSSVKALIALAPPFNVRQVVTDMGQVYQRFFVKRYIYETVTRHEQMKYWEKIGLVNLEEVKRSQNLDQFHTSITAKILGFSSSNELFAHYNVSPQDIANIKVDTLLMTSKDDPIVSYSSMPHSAIKQNSHIQFVATERGGHLCWFEGIIPKRWYPKPTLEYLRSIRKQ